MDAHAELQNSGAKTRTVVFVCQREGGTGGKRRLERFPMEALTPNDLHAEPKATTEISVSAFCVCLAKALIHWFPAKRPINC